MKDKDIQKITFSTMVIAFYIVVVFASQWIDFYQIQLRIATSLYALPAFFPFLILPLGLASGLSSTLFGGLGIIDIIGALLVGLLTSSFVLIIKRLNLNDWFIALPIIFIPGLIVPIWLAPIQSSLPNAASVSYVALATSMTLEQVIPGLLGVFIIKYLRKRNVSRYLTFTEKN